MIAMNPLFRRSVVFLAGASSALLWSCTGPSATPVTDEQRILDIERVAPQPTAAMAARSGETLERIGVGYWVFQRKCLECHEARVPQDPSDEDWHPVMEGMMWNAGLDAREEGAVLAYLRAAAR